VIPSIIFQRVSTLPTTSSSTVSDNRNSSLFSLPEAIYLSLFIKPMLPGPSVSLNKPASPQKYKKADSTLQYFPMSVLFFRILGFFFHNSRDYLLRPNVPPPPPRPFTKYSMVNTPPLFLDRFFILLCLFLSPELPFQF